MRVYEIAREVGLPNKELITKIRALGLEVNNHMSYLDPDDVVRLKRSLERERLANTETKRLSSTVLRRRSRASAKPLVRKGDQLTARPAAAETKADRAAAVAARPSEKTPAEKPRPAAEAPVRRRAVGEKPLPSPGPTVVEKPLPPTPMVADDIVRPAAGEAAPPPPPVRGKAPVVIEGPKAVEVLRTAKPSKKVAAPPKEAAAAPAVAKREEAPAPAPTTVREVEETARDRFEQELARARSRAVEREADQVREQATPSEDESRDPSRPAVGSIISLPVPRIKITERAPTKQILGQGQIRGRFAQQRGRANRAGRDFAKKKAPPKKAGKQTQITTPAEHKRIIRMEETIAIPDFARSMGVKANEVLRKLWSMGMLGININAAIDYETAQIIASEFGYEVQNIAFKEEQVFVSKEDEAADLRPRAPVVTVMGHVDHGKTSLLDSIRRSSVAKGEAGGITQHIAAYRVRAGVHGDIVFLDTPGHEAFTEMRARGAQCTDIVVLVVAADDGVMPQTIEALNHAKDAGVGIIVAVNKCDLPDAKPERIRQQLGEHGLIPEEWGGDTIYVDVSAITGEGVDKLLEAISITAELLELRANPDKAAVGTVIEAKLDRNRGPMATVLIEEGTIKAGDTVVVGEHFGKVRAMLDDRGELIYVAGPATPIELLGLDGVPQAGETLNVIEDERKAKQVVEHRRQLKRKKELATTSRVSLENIMERIQEGEAVELKIVLKADVQGSAEAIKDALTKLSTEKVRVNVIQAGVGGITESDVNLAKAGGAIIVGFHVRAAGKSAKLAEKEGVEINLYNVIYEALDSVKAAMAGLLAPVKKEISVGTLQVRETFNIPKMGTVAGCFVSEGKVHRKFLVRVIRDAVQIYEGKIGSLRRFKDDVSEVSKGFECGLIIEGFNDVNVGDVIEAYEIVEEAATL